MPMWKWLIGPTVRDCLCVALMRPGECKLSPGNGVCDICDNVWGPAIRGGVEDHPSFLLPSLSVGICLAGTQ